MIVIFSHDRVGPRMAGPGIRYVHLARALAREFEVLLAAPEGSEPPGDLPGIVFRDGAEGSVREAVRSARAVVVPVPLVPSLSVLWEAWTLPVVVDGYDPLLAETLALGVDPEGVLRAQTLAALRGDFFLCASPRQRDWWLGWLEAMGRINPYTWGEDPTFQRLVAVVPTGVPETPPPTMGPVARRVWPELPADATLVVWGGGLWPWMDPLTAIRAIARIRTVRPEVCLVFPGVRHPNPRMAGIPTHAAAARSLAEALGLLGRAVFFADWLPYSDWMGLLQESRIGLSLHRDSLEAGLAFRTRVLDYIWAGLPVIATRGDGTSDWIARYGLGIVVEAGDVEGVAQGILTLLEQPLEALRGRFEEARRALAWPRVAEPLIAFCRQPRCAPDRIAMGDRLGNPFYRAEIQRLQALVAGYERGRFIRWMRRLHRWRQRLIGGRP